MSVVMEGDPACLGMYNGAVTPFLKCMMVEGAPRGVVSLVPGTAM
jgi:hypothetical protein